MCGIAGIILPDGGQPDRATLDGMTATLSHRGPDSSGCLIVPGCGLGHRRLSIIDLEHGDQPLVCPQTGVAIALNGEIFNFKELRQELKGRGHRFRTASDTEVVLNGYIQWGVCVLEHLVGMFAIAIWDPHKRQLLLARDRMGQKPLYWALLPKATQNHNDTQHQTNTFGTFGTCSSNSNGRSNSRGLIFGSELSVILKNPDISQELDPESLYRYLVFEYVPSPRTMIKGVYKLEPGSCLIYRPDQECTGSITSTTTTTANCSTAKACTTPLDGPLTTNPSINTWWRMEFGKIALPETTASAKGVKWFQNLQEEFTHRLDQAVASQLVADVNVGVLLSGGLDSSAITAAACNHLSPSSLSTFSMGFEDQSYDESGHALAVAKHLRTRHHCGILKRNELLDWTIRAVSRLDEPLADPSIVPTTALAFFSREHVKVVLGGDGGDELLAGYPTFWADRAANQFSALPAPLRHGISAMVNLLPTQEKYFSLSFKARSFLRGAQWPPGLRHQIWLSAFTPNHALGVMSLGLRERVRGVDPLDQVMERFWGGNYQSRCDAMTDFYARFYLADCVLTKVDRATMAASLEARAPFLDHRLVEFLCSLPANTKMQGQQTKVILRRAFENKLPPNIIKRKKQGFSVPVTSLLKHELKELAQDLLSPQSLARQGLFDPEPVQHMLNQHMAGKADMRKPLWTLLAFQLWYQKLG